MRRNTFKDKDLQATFQEKGYVVVPFLNEEEVAYLRKAYYEMDHDLGEGFHATMHSHLVDYRRKVSELVGSVFTPKANELLDDYRQLVSNYTVKEPGEASFFDFHLDWNMADEREADSITIWCPLEDVNEENGNLWVLDKSPQLGQSLRVGPGLHLYLMESQDPKDFQFKKRALQLKAGEAVIYTHMLFHGSPPNLTDKARIAINQAMMPRELPSLHYCHLDEDTIGVYEVDDDYYHRCIIGQNPPAETKLLKRLPVPGPHTVQETVNKMILDEARI